MKLKFYSTLVAVALRLNALSRRLHRFTGTFTCWCIDKATAANLASCNSRQTARTRFL